MKIGIAIDAWKLRIFERRLTEAGYTFEQAPGILTGMKFLHVITEDPDALLIVVKAANTEAARVGAKS